MHTLCWWIINTDEFFFKIEWTSLFLTEAVCKRRELNFVRKEIFYYDDDDVDGSDDGIKWNE